MSCEQQVITFFSKKEEYQTLSNFWEAEVWIEDVNETRKYATGEHCFHGEKFIRLGELVTDAERAAMLTAHGRLFVRDAVKPLATALDAKRRGGKGRLGFILTKDELDIWYEISTAVQLKICEYKMKHYQEVCDDLRMSGDKILVHPALRVREDDLERCIWEGRATKVNGKIVILGQNRLGNIWMQCRDKMFS
jgi:predicted NAD-dependent protein-ADP-ribosyltransferase YbiA (DUF1768 family)